MKRLTVLVVILALALGLVYIKDRLVGNSIGTVVVNEARFPKFETRLELRKCIEGEKGRFTEPMEITLFTDSGGIEKYRALKARIEDWGGKCVLRKETEQNIFDFRALGELSLYIWDEGELYEAFLSKNEIFYSTGFKDADYDRLISEGAFDEAVNMLIDNINVVIA